MNHCRALLGLLFLLSPAVPTASADWWMEVSAGDFERRETPVSVFLPMEARRAFVLQSAEGNSIPLQVDAQGVGWFVLPYLAKGETTRLRMLLEGEANPLDPWVEVVPERNRLRLSIAGQPALFYQMEERAFPRPDLNPRIKRGGFIHPVVTPSGRIVSQSYPARHPHHQGIWSAWTRTEFEGRRVDFWNMHGGSGKVEFGEVEETWSGPVQGGFRSKHRFIALTTGEPKVILHETWTVRLYQSGESGRLFRLFDLLIDQENATSEPLVLPEYHYGGLGFRGPDAWMGAETTFFLTSEGETDRRAGNQTRARWTHVSGLVDDQAAGIAIMGHPENFRSPQPVRLHPAEPFFCFAPSQLGDWEISPSQPYAARFRFVAADGPPDAGEIERLWLDFAHPPTAKVIPPSGGV